MPKNLWNDSDVAGLSELDLLAYRSRLLAADRSVVNLYGGNTSAKVLETDHMGRSVTVLWVKGSGLDMANGSPTQFAGLRLDDLLPLMNRDVMSDEAMLDYLSRCVFEPNRPRQSIEALLHAFIPHRHIDHIHPDAVLALACAANGETAAREIFGAEMIWLPYQRPGFALSKQVGRVVQENPQARCVILAKHGLVAWGADAKSCYANTIAIIQKAEDALNAAQKRIFTGTDLPALSPEQRAEVAAQIMPLVRGAVSEQQHQIVLLDDSEATLKFVGTAAAKTVSQMGMACPCHLIHTKRLPLFVDWDGESVDQLKIALREGLAAYHARYKDYFETERKENSRLNMADPNPRLVLVPRLGMLCIGADATNADIARQLYQRSMAVMELTTRIGDFAALSAQEAFEIEYWSMERDKLNWQVLPRELAGRIALVTGAASGIGRAIAQRLAEAGAHVVIADIAMDGAQAVADGIIQHCGYKRAVAVKCNVTREDEVIRAFNTAVLAYGGVDIVVNNAGFFLGNPIEQTTVEEWQRMTDVLNTGYFLVARQAFRCLRVQGRGGSVIFIGSKNSVYPGKNVSAYSAAKAAELHMARCLAEEGGSGGIRVNAILPDAVVRGSGIWYHGAREQRARNYGIKPDELEEYYRARTTLKVSIYPEDVAEAALFFASDKSIKTTGAALNVDGGVAGAYPR